LQARIHKCAGTCGAIGARALVGELNRLERALKLDHPVTQSELDGLSHLWQDTRGEIALHKTAA
jgi:HPt (histidine-containing phosphotransfer) domain-containing protein